MNRNISVSNDCGELERYNIFKACLLIRHAGKKSRKNKDKTISYLTETHKIAHHNGWL